MRRVYHRRTNALPDRPTDQRTQPVRCFVASKNREKIIPKNSTFTIQTQTFQRERTVFRCVPQERIFKRGSVCCSVCRLSIHMSLKPPQKSQILALSNCSDVTHQTEHSQGCLEVVLSVFPSIYLSYLSSLFSICLASSQCTQRHSQDASLPC